MGGFDFFFLRKLGFGDIAKKIPGHAQAANPYLYTCTHKITWSKVRGPPKTKVLPTPLHSAPPNLNSVPTPSYYGHMQLDHSNFFSLHLCNPRDL